MCDIPDAVISQHWQLLKCLGCDKPVLREYWYHELLDDPTSIKYNIVYPLQNIQRKPLPVFNHLPKLIENLHSHAKTPPYFVRPANAAHLPIRAAKAP
ncbi:MAG: hypothetical protein LBG57_02715 [Treponema sp.]|nr:hypothetical protein [Treponema sp.]